MTWHAAPETLHGYAEGRISAVQASSVEAHLVTCDACRSSVAAGADRARLDTLWSEITAAVDAPVPGAMERLLGRLGVPEHVGRLLASTPGLRLSWLAAVIVTLAFAVSAARRGDGDVGLVLFLVLAPLLPLAGVAASFGPGIDPVYEVAVAAPLRSLDLLLLRAAAVLATTTVLVGAAALTVPHADWGMAVWLLPACGLTAGSLALSTWVTPWRAAAALASVWVAAAAVGLRLAAGASPGGPVVERFVAFRPSGQLSLAVFTVAAVVIVALRRDALEIGELRMAIATVQIDELTKSFGSFRALSGVSFSTGTGVTGLLGPNGAGKTTLLRIAATVLGPDSGRLQLLGCDPARPDERLALRRRLGFLPQEPGFYGHFTTFEFVDYVAILKEMHERRPRHDEVRRVLAAVGLEDQSGKKIKALSGGMRRRLGLAQALLREPDLLVLDEPTAGLDPEQRLRFRELVSEIGEHRTVLLSTHQTEDVATLCHRVVVLTGGEVRFDGSVPALADLARGRVWISDRREPGARLAWRTGDGRARNIGDPPAGADLAEPTIEDAYLLLAGEMPAEMAA